METAVDLLGDLCEVFAILLLRTLISAGMILDWCQQLKLFLVNRVKSGFHWKKFKVGELILVTF